MVATAWENAQLAGVRGYESYSESQIRSIALIHDSIEPSLVCGEIAEALGAAFAPMIAQFGDGDAPVDDLRDGCFADCDYQILTVIRAVNINSNT